MKHVLLALLLAACAGAPAPQWTSAAADANAVVAAERAFAAHAGREGWLPAFREYAAADAVVFAPDLVNAQASLAAFEDDGDTSLQWWPVFAGVALSGEFGYTTGPAVSGDQPSGLQYFTVWRRQRDGSWKWIYDGGAGAVDPAPPPRDVTPGMLPLANRGVGSSAAAVAEIRAIEAALAPNETLERWLAPDARVNRGGLAPAVGRESFVSVLNRPALPVTYSTLRAEASEAGDMVFTLGDARWTREGRQINAHYARIWQLRADGWRIVFDQIM